MKKCLFAVMIMVAATLIASDARQDAFGFGSKYIADANDVLYNPALSIDWANQARCELGNYVASGVTPANQWGFAALSLGDELSIGAALRRREGDIFQIAPSYGVISPNPGIDIWGAYRVGDIKLGLGIYTAGNKESEVNDNTNTSFEESSGIFKAKLGIGLPVFKSTEIALGFAMNSFNETTTNADNEEMTFDLTGGTEISLAVRSFIPVEDIFEIVPVLGFSSFSFGDEFVAFNGDETTSGDFSRMRLSAGVGINTEVVRDGIVSVAFGMGMENFIDELDTTDKVEDKVMYFPEVSVAAEVPLRDWVSVRAGMGKVFGSYTNIQGDIESKSKITESAANFITFGAGFKFNNVVFDVSITEDKLFEGAHFISGLPNNLAARATLGIEW
ncbi:MAG TPA: hypothetical protein ENN07_06205 [candidate division Zixibacteria bacterium]|nr:hypothetical protein [candidate division Zixibacteria bacterium]